MSTFIVNFDGGEALRLTPTGQTSIDERFLEMHCGESLEAVHAHGVVWGLKVSAGLDRDPRRDVLGRFGSYCVAGPPLEGCSWATSSLSWATG